MFSYFPVQDHVYLCKIVFTCAIMAESSPSFPSFIIIGNSPQFTCSTDQHDHELSEGGPGACKSAYPLIYGGNIAILLLFPLNQIL